MKQIYFSPSTKVVNIQNVKSVMATSTLGVSSQNYSEGSMTDLAREETWNIWGTDNDD